MSRVRPSYRVACGGSAALLLAAALTSATAFEPDAVAQRPEGDAHGTSRTTGNGAGIPEPYGASLSEPVWALYKAVRHYSGKIGLSVIDLKTGRTVASQGADAALNPASNAKLLTAWAVLKTHGPQHRFFTGLYGRLRDDRVDVLVLRGDGDPQFEHPHLYEMAAQLAQAGVKMVGDIVVDQSRFDDKQEPPAFEQQPDEWASFRAPVAAVSLDGNTVHVTVFPTAAGQLARVRGTPPSVLDVVGAVGTTSSKGSESVHIELASLREGRQRAAISGNIPANSPPLTIWRRTSDPSRLAGNALADVCRELGIKVHGRVRLGHPVPQELLASHKSPPVGRLLHALGKHSDNFHAEMLFKSLAPLGRPASFDAARARVFDLLAQAGIDARGVKMLNGSGLFDADRMSAEFITSLLKAAVSDSSIAPEFVSQLAIGGVDGTLRNRFEELGRARSVRAKSGTLRAVSSLSGYVLGRDGAPRFAFSVIVNNVPDASTELRKEMDAVVSALASLAARSST